MSLFYCIVNNGNQVIHSTFNDVNLQNRLLMIETDYQKLDRAVAGTRTDLVGTRVLVYSAKEEDFKRKKSFLEKLNFICEIADSVVRMRTLTHNMESIAGKMVQEFDYTCPPHLLASCNTHKDQLDAIQKVVKKSPEMFVESYLKQRKYAEFINSELNALTKLKSGELNLNYHKIRDIVYSSASKLFDDFRKREIYLRFEMGVENKRTCDFSILSTVFFNLFHNATKYASHGKEIQIRFKENFEDYRVEIEMISLKIHDDEIEKIFQSGYRGKENKRTGVGSGLGLHVVKELINLHQGTIEIVNNASPTVTLTNDSQEFNRNIFSVRLPKTIGQSPKSIRRRDLAS